MITGCLGCVSVVKASDPTLVGWWKLDEGSGTLAHNSASSKHDGTVWGSPAWVGGRTGWGLKCDGVDDYVDTGFTVDLPKWTISVWVKSPTAPAEALPSGPVHREQNFQINWNHTDPMYRGAAVLCIGDLWYPASFGSLTANTWYHLAATYDGDNLRAYKNGVLVTANKAPSGPANPETNSLKIGRHAAAWQFFTGTIDEVRVYNRALSAAEVAELNTVVYGGGNGTAEDPYQIWTPEQMNILAARPDDWDQHFTVMLDLDFEWGSPATIAPDTDNSLDNGFQGTAFEGFFDGNGHRILSARIEHADHDFVGLFGMIGTQGGIRNLGLENIIIDGRSSVGSLCGYNEGSILSCYSIALVHGSEDVGGLVGANRRGTIRDCYSLGDVTGTTVQIGGLVGFLDFGSVQESYSRCSVQGRNSVGGLVGRSGGQIMTCYAMGPVTASGVTNVFDVGVGGVGGLVGENSWGVSQTHGSIYDCYATGAVTLTMTGWCGGLVGSNEYLSTISFCYAVGKISGAGFCSGLVGAHHGGQTQYSFWDTQTSGQQNSWGGIGLKTFEMKSEELYRANTWVFKNPIGWRIIDGQTYPYLQMKKQTGSPDLNGDGEVDLEDFVLFSSHWMAIP